MNEKTAALLDHIQQWQRDMLQELREKEAAFSYRAG